MSDVIRLSARLAVESATVSVGSLRPVIEGGVASLQSKSVDPSESEIVVEPDSGYDGLSDVTVGAISSSYVGSGITRRGSGDLSASGATVSVPSGYYESSASKAVASGSATTPATTITANPSISVGSDGKITATVSKSQNVTPTVSAGYVSSGTAGAIGVTGSATSQLSTQAGTTISPTESEQTAVASGKYTTGAVKVGAISSTYVGSGITSRSSSDLSASGATVSVPAGYYSSAASKAISNGSVSASATKGTVSNHQMSVTPTATVGTAGYLATGSTSGTAVTVSASELCSGTKSISSNGTGIDVVGYAKVDVSVGGGAPSLQTKTKNYTPSESQQTETVTADSGYDGLSSVGITVGAISSTYVGSGITRRSSTDLSASGATVSVPSGYYSSAASKAVSTGTEGTPVATKSAVSNHALTVTPSVTNQTGFITGSTKTGTAVTVQASELVSGNLAITENGTGISVANYSTVSVAVEGGGGGGLSVYTASTTPQSASQSISFTGLSGEPTSFYVIATGSLATGTPAKTAAVVFDGTTICGQTITNTSNAQASYDGTNFSKSFNNGTLTITGSSYWQNIEYTLVYTVGGSSANIGTASTQVGSGATSITFTGLPDDPTCWGLIFTDDFGTSSGYSRVISVINDGSTISGLEMSSGASYTSNWTANYTGGSLTISSQSTSAGGYFHQPGYYVLTYATGGNVEVEIEQLTVTQNGTYQESGKAYSPVIVSVSGGGGASVDTKTITNDTNTATSISFTSLKGTPVAFFVRCTTQMQSSSTTYYYVSNMRYNGTNVNGNAFRMGSTRQVTVVTSGYSYTYSSGTLTLTSSGSRTSSPGSFYNGNYELVYCY